MPTTTEDILAHFPFPSARPGQVDAIRFAKDAFDSGKKVVIIEAPCGSGKSAIGLGLTGHYDRSYYLTIQKILQDQLITEFGDGGRYSTKLVDLKGRSSYECVYYKNKADQLLTGKTITLKQYGEYKNFHDCADGHCRKNGENKYDECLSKRWCPYFIQKEKAAAAKVCLMNFAGFLNHTAFGGENFGHRNLMIIDEAHNIEEQLLSFISTTLLESDFDNILKLPDFDYPSQYVEWIIANKIDLIYHTKAAQARALATDA
jgi:Rad3-related DNA helicase